MIGRTHQKLLKRLEEQRALKLERLSAAIRDGDEALTQGYFTDLAEDEELTVFFAKL